MSKKTTPTPAEIDPVFDNYIKHCKENYPRAKHILEKTLESKEFNFSNEINILVPYAGSFPSFLPFVDILTKQNVREVNFVLVDSSKRALNLFRRFLELYEEFSPPNLTLKFGIFGMDFSQFLRDELDTYTKDKKLFDLIYFEHPIIDAHYNVTAYMNIYPTLLQIRKSIPLLANWITSNGRIMMICQRKSEIRQAESLLTYGLEAQTKELSLLNNFFPEPYAHSVITTRQINLNIASIQRNSLGISISDKLLVFFLIISLGLIVKGFVNADPLSSFYPILMLAHISLHRPGLKGASIKILLCLAQATLMEASNNLLPNIHKMK